MTDLGGIVLAGGRSSRMGTPKAALEWHRSTLLRRIVGIVKRAVDGPVIVVRAPGQLLPPLPADIAVIADMHEGRGPLQGIATGLHALQGDVAAAYVSATDVPFLHPQFIAALSSYLGDHVDAVLPEVSGHRQPLAAIYRTTLASTAQRLLMTGRKGPLFLLEHCRLRPVSSADLLSDRLLKALDPTLDSVLNLNDPAAYAAARARSAAPISVTVRHRDGSDSATITVPAATLACAAAAVDVTLSKQVRATLADDLQIIDPQTPLVAGDSIVFTL